MARVIRKEHLEDMYQAILELKTLEECRNFFEDLCSLSELSAMEQRYAVADLLLQNTVYLEILKKTSASTATISRVNRVLNTGTGCLPEIIEKTRAKKLARQAEADKAEEETAESGSAEA